MIDDDKVVGISPGWVAPGNTCEDVVTKLEDFLAMARRGELRSVAIAASDVTGAIRTGSTWKADAMWALLGALSHMHHRILHEVMEEMTAL